MRTIIKNIYPYYPIIGLGGYAIIFFIALSNYPGGSYNDPSFIGYSHFHNFLCDLTLFTTESGAINPARPLAIYGHLLLSFGMISFFYILPEIFEHQNRNTKLVRWMGILTMTIFIFMFTDQHDFIVTLTGLFGTVALIPFFIELPKLKNRGLRWLAYWCFILSIIVFISFETKQGFYYLPLLQKFTFIFDAWWVIWVSLIVARKRRILPG